MTPLSDLEPRWIDRNMFVFLCPHCREVYLTCKNSPMDRSKQWELFEQEFGEYWNAMVVPSAPESVWDIATSFPVSAEFPADVTVHPSIDASASGHWHGFIQNGMCQ